MRIKKAGVSEATIQPLIISAPFGNYIQPTGTTPTLGTFTAAARPGRLWRIVRTVRRYRRLGAWVNRIGLRNPGIDWLVRRVEAGRVTVADKIVSIHGFSEEDWASLLQRLAGIRPLAVELNMSCPNVGELAWPTDLFRQAVATADLGRVIVKLPPIHYELMANEAAEAGVRWFHCCNTLPVPAGGLSGKPLKPLSLACIRHLRHHLLPQLDPDGLHIIGGGGITTLTDIDDYIAEGACHVAIGTKVMHPLYLFTDRPLRPLIEHAHRKRPVERGE